jgi:hypothetical protein
LEALQLMGHKGHKTRSGRFRPRGCNSQESSDRDARQSRMEKQDRQAEENSDANEDVAEKFHLAYSVSQFNTPDPT